MNPVPPRTAILALALLGAGALVGRAQSPAPPARKAPVPPTNRKPPGKTPPPRPATPLPEDIKTAKDPGARDDWKPSGPDDPYIYPYGDTATYRDTAEGGVATLDGNARLLYKETRFASARITYNRKTQIGTAPGKLQVDDDQNTIVGDRGQADYGRKIARITGAVTVTARPKPGGEDAPEGSVRREFKNPVTITGSEVVYNWKTRVADTSKDTVIRFTAQDRTWTVTADRIQYRGNEETAFLEGNVVARTDRDEELRGAGAVVVLADGKETIDIAKVQKGSKFIVEDKDEDKADPKKPGPGDAKPKTDDKSKTDDKTKPPPTETKPPAETKPPPVKPPAGPEKPPA